MSLTCQPVQAINLLQSAQRMHPMGDAVTVSDITDVACVVPSHVVTGLLAACRHNFKHAQAAAHAAITAGYSISQLTDQLHRSIIMDDAINDVAKCHMLIRIAEADRKLSDGADETLQLLDILAWIGTCLGQ